MANKVITQEQFKEMEILKGIDNDDIYAIVTAYQNDREHLVVWKLIATNDNYAIFEEQETL